MIRPARPADQAFIASTWTRSICSTHKVPGVSSHGHAYQRHVGSAMWTKVSAQVDAVMDRRDSKALVVCRPSDENALLGWVCYAHVRDVPLIHYVYLRRDERERGHAADLLRAIGVHHGTAVVCTSLGPSSQMMRSRYKAASFLPLDEFLEP